MSTPNAERVVFVVDSVFTNAGDDGHPGRRNRIAEKLRSVLDCTTVKVIDFSPNAVMSSDLDLVAVFVHLTDVVEKGYIDLCDALSRVQVPIVAYSGGGVSADKSTKEKLTTKRIANLQHWFFVHKKLEDPDDYSDSAWHSLVNWILDPRRSTEEDSLPAIIALPRILEYGLALSILCQGFLADYALRNVSDGGGVDVKGHSEIGMGLFKMGWVADAKAEKVSDEVAALGLCSNDGVPEIDFWTGPFEGGDKSLREGIQSELPKNQTSIPSDVEALVKAIEEQRAPDVVVVAKAYDQISNLLEAMGC
jgi:hypothetical protein